MRARVAALDVAPSMPPASILIVRSLAASLRSSTRYAAADAASLRARMESLAATARRPARGEVGGADAVWFRDDSELMACLLEDVVCDRSGSRWYWQSIAESFGRPFSVARALAHSPLALPAIVAALDARRMTTLVMVRLSADEATSLALAMVDAYRRPELADAVRAARIPAHQPSPAGRGDREGPHHPPSVLPARRAGEGDEPRDVLSSAHLVLLRLARALSSTANRLCGGTPNGHQVLEGSINTQDERSAPHVSDPRSSTEPGGTPSAASRTPSSHDQRPDRREPTGETADPGPVGHLRPQSTPGMEMPTAPHSQKLDRPPTRPINGSEAQAGDTGWPTRYGGVFYLLRAVDELAPRADVEAWRTDAEPIGRWRLFELVMRGLLEAARRFDPDDGLWRALSELDGRDATSMSPLRLPRRLARKIQPVTAAVIPWIQHALELAQGGAQDVVDACAIARARIFITPLHLDVVAPLDEIRIGVRRAGLDVDPGWIPEWGRIVRFHFVDRTESRWS